MGIPRLREKLGSVWVAIALLAVSQAPAALGAAPLRQAGDAKRTIAEVERYWTSQRMEMAKPLDAAVEPSGAAPRAAEPMAPRSSGVAFTSFELTNTTSFPNRVHGKVFFTRPGEGNFVCSGTAVDAENRATVITAGHCVYDAGVWSTNFAFVPGYHPGLTGMLTASSPYGVWGASSEAAPQTWVDSQNFKYDVGAVVVAADVLGQHLEDVVGARPIAFNQATSQRFRSHGYPAQPTAKHSFDGYKLWACDSSPPVADNPTSSSGPATMGIGCDMTGGASGGGWVTNGGLLNGVNSYRYSGQPDLMYGPYFGPTIKALYEFAGTRSTGGTGSQAAGNGDPASPGAASAPTTPRPACKKKKQRRKAKARHSAKRACKAKR